MAVIGNKYLDLIDLYKSTDKAGDILDVIELLADLNPFIKDALWVECNSGAQHITSVRTGLPDVSWGRLYKGIPNDKSQRVQVTDTTGFVEGRSAVDSRLIDDLSNGNGAALRLSEAEAFLESMGQEVGSKMFYGNDATLPEAFMGLSPRFNDLSAINGEQIVDAGGTGADNTSLWFVTWGDNQVNALYPQGSFMGVKREDRGKQSVEDANGDRYEAYEEVFRQHAGLSVRDWRYVVRVANIDVSDLKAGTVNLYDFLRQGYYKLQSRRVAAGMQMIYCNTDVMEALDALAHNAGASDNFVRLRPMEIQGEEVMTYRGIPIRETDALVNSEAQVT